MPPHEVLGLSSVYLVALIGLFVGGIASYIADLLLFEEGFRPSIEKGSYCGHRASVLDAIPFLALLMLDGKCKACKRRVKWQYLAAEIIMACSFVAVIQCFGMTLYSGAMMFFVAVLVTICITDFKAKIIPHEITYPAILIGVIFSAMTKSDLFGALAGIGVSYVLFDFLAFYGLKFFLWVHPPVLESGRTFLSADAKQGVRLTKLKRGGDWISKESEPVIKRESKTDYANIRLFSRGMPVESLEVIGGGDAVLSALISAWLGWQKLLMALAFGFIIGTILGAIYVLVELRKERMLQTIVFPVLSCVVGLCIFAVTVLFILATSFKESFFVLPYQYILPGAVAVGLLLGIIIAGTRISKPFPFGPALALGAMIALFRQS